MTTTSPPASAAPRRRGAGPGRVLAVMAAVCLLIIGACLALGGIALMATFGTDGQVSTAKHPVATPTAAVITDVATIRDTSEVADALGTPVAHFAADGGNASGLFIGIGPAAEVDHYLAGVEVDQAVDFEVDPYSLDLARRNGTETSADPPTEQDFWVASGTASSGLDLSWQVQDGNFRMVLMNADGAPGVQAQLGVGLGLAGMFWLALGLLIGAAVLIAVAITLLVVTRRRPPLADSRGYSYPPPGDGPPSGAAPAPGLAPPAGYRPVATTAPGSAPPVDPAPPVREPQS